MRLHSSCRFTVSSQCTLSSKCEHRLKMGRRRPGVEGWRGGGESGACGRFTVSGLPLDGCWAHAQVLEQPRAKVGSGLWWLGS